MKSQNAIRERKGRENWAAFRDFKIGKRGKTERKQKWVKKKSS